MFFWKQNWWVVLVFAFLTLFYFHFLQEKKISVNSLARRLEEVEKRKYEARKEQDELELRIASQADPAFIEMVLMRDLGVVPEGFLKVHFKQ